MTASLTTPVKERLNLSSIAHRRCPIEEVNTSGHLARGTLSTRKVLEELRGWLWKLLGSDSISLLSQKRKFHSYASDVCPHRNIPLFSSTAATVNC